MKQRTLKRKYHFEGKGLHSGKISHMTLCPAPENHGIKFLRTDIGPKAVIEAVSNNVTSTARSTTISKGGATVGTIEHVMAALTGLGVDNVLIEIDNVEVPILDGSAKCYADAITADGLQEQGRERIWLEPSEVINIEDDKTGSYIKIIPDNTFSLDLAIDFNSRVLGVQKASWKLDEDFATQIAPCRTFVFFHELEFLASSGLVKGGDVDNAIVIVEHPATEEQIERLSSLFKQPKLAINEKGMLNNLELRFDNECGRHKLLDLIGDLRLAGGFLKAHIVAYKPGHSLNTKAAQTVRLKLK